MLNIVCIKLGDKYGANYVNRLASMVKRHTKKEYRFHCITDDAVGLKVAGQFTKPNLEGWWGKLQVFEQGLFKDNDEVLLLDLDIIILRDLDSIIDYGRKQLREGREMVIIEDFNRPNGYGSAIVMFGANRLPHVYNEFEVDRDGIMARYHGDQEYLEKVVPCAAFWPRDWVLSYKVDKLHDKDPSGEARVVCFHGPPKNHEVDDKWVNKSWG